MPARSEKALGKVVDLLADRLHPHFHLMLQRYDAILRERMATERDGARLGDWMASREALARRGELFFPAFIASLRQGCLAAFDHSPPQKPQKVISLMGVKQCGPRTRGTTYSAAARQ